MGGGGGRGEGGGGGGEVWHTGVRHRPAVRKDMLITSTVLVQLRPYNVPGPIIGPPIMTVYLYTCRV